MVLHDVNHAAKYSHACLSWRNAGIYRLGKPEEVLTADDGEMFTVRAGNRNTGRQPVLLRPRPVADIGSNA